MPALSDWTGKRPGTTGSSSSPQGRRRQAVKAFGRAAISKILTTCWAKDRGISPEERRPH
jgi:hypothetical protein